MIAVEILAAILLLGLLIACNVNEAVAAAIATMFIAFASAIVGLAGALAGKSSIEHLANGGGVKGAVKAVMSDSGSNKKPGDP